jgi:hypothetical protein
MLKRLSSLLQDLPHIVSRRPRMVARSLLLIRADIAGLEIFTNN